MEDAAEVEIQAKQTLLQTEIIEKNYDKTSFINFCLSKKENGTISYDRIQEVRNIRPNLSTVKGGS